MKKKTILHAWFFALMAIGLPQLGSAAIIELQGGDSGEGYAPLSNVFAAKAFGQSNLNVPVQGVTFNTNPSAISITSNNTGDNHGGFGFQVNTTANDINLSSVLSGQIFSYGTFLIGITGLTVGQSYQLDSFFAPLGNSSRYMTVDAVGLVTNSDEGNLNSPYLSYNISQTLMPDLLGNINITYSAYADSSKSVVDYPILNGISVTAVPEPTTIVMAMFISGAVFMTLIKSKKQTLTL